MKKALAKKSREDVNVSRRMEEEVRSSVNVLEVERRGWGEKESRYMAELEQIKKKADKQQEERVVLEEKTKGEIAELKKQLEEQKKDSQRNKQLAEESQKKAAKKAEEYEKDIKNLNNLISQSNQGASQ